MAESADRRKAGRPRTPVLSRALILETALALFDERGTERVKMGDIAKALGVRTSALYNHVEGYEDMVAGIRELISDRIDVRSFRTAPWHEALADWADSYRAAFAAHPPTIALLAILPLVPNSRTSLMYDEVVRALVAAGWPEERALSVIVAIEAYLLGSALDLAAAPSMLDPGERDDVPAFSGAYAARSAHLSVSGETPADAAYRIGISALIAGLRAELARLTSA